MKAICSWTVVANLVQPKFGPRTIYCRTILVLGPFLSCYLAYFGPTLGLIFAARNGPRTIPFSWKKLALGTSSGCLE